MSNKDKTAVSIYLDDELKNKIDKDAAESMRTRKAQVMYIVNQYYKNEEKK